MFLVQRVRDILLRPTPTWRAILTEPTEAGTVFSRYVMPLAGLAALAVASGLTLVGVGAGEVRQRLPLTDGLVRLAAGFLFSLLAVYVMAHAVNALASSFGARQSPRRSMMLVGYASTAAFVGALFALVPALAGLGLVFALYSVYLLYTGLPVLMRCPPRRAAAYTGLSVACAVLTVGALAALFALIVPARTVERGAGPATLPSAAVSPAMPSAAATAAEAAADPVDAPAAAEPPRVATMTRSMQEAHERLGAARKAGDAAAASAALNDMKLALTRSGLPPLDPQVMQAALPNRFSDGLYLAQVQTHSGRAMDVPGGSEVQADYGGPGGRKVQIVVFDLGPRGLMLKKAQWQGDASEEPGNVNRIAGDGKRTHRELFRPRAAHAEIATVLANGLVVELRADKSDLPTLKKLLTEVDLDRLEALQRPPAS